ncbi:MAG: hypothetical protein ACLPWS_04140 [Rhodomicrobium sp.]
MTAEPAIRTRKKTVSLLAQPPAPKEEPAPEPVIRMKSKGVPSMAKRLAAAEHAVFGAYERSIGISRRGILTLQDDRPFIYQAGYMARLRAAVIGAADDDQRLALLENGVRFFNKMSTWNRAKIAKQIEVDQFYALEICCRLVDPAAAVKHWRGRPRPSEFFGRTDPRDPEEFAEAPVERRPLPVWPEKDSVPIMNGVQIDGLSKHHAMQPRPKPKTVRKLGIAEPGEPVPIMANTEINEIDSHGQRTLRDANGLVQNSRVANGALKW